jgi:hypothetical membrane protein
MDTPPALPPQRRPSVRFRKRRRLLAVGMAAPVLALAAVLLSLLAYPNFNQARQYLSELGGTASHAPYIFNDGIFLAGAMAIAAGFGFGLSIIGLAGSRVAGVATMAVFTVAGGGLMIASIYIWPDPRHNQAANLGLGILLGPLLLLWGLRSRRDMPRLKAFLVAVVITMSVLTVLTKHLLWPHLVNDDNVGWWERGFAIVLVGWVGIAAFVLERRLEIEARQGIKPNASNSR